MCFPAAAAKCPVDATARSALHAVLVRHGQAAMPDTAGLLASELLTSAYLRSGMWDSDPHPRGVGTAA